MCNESKVKVPTFPFFFAFFFLSFRLTVLQVIIIRVTETILYKQKKLMEKKKKCRKRKIIIFGEKNRPLF